MKQLKRLWLWCLLLTKRLYKKPTFVILLALIPVLVLLYAFSAQEDSGMLTITLAMEDASDPIASDISQQLMEDPSLIRFIQANSINHAQQLVEMGKADAAWIFPSDMQGHMNDFISDSTLYGGFIRIVQREETVPLRLAREKLSSAIYVHCARAYYLRYIRNSELPMEQLTDDQVLAYFDGVNTQDTLFSFSSAEAAQSVGITSDTGYLLTPVRGLLAVVILLGAMATAMYYIRDDAAGTFSWVPISQKPMVELGYQMISNVNVAAVALVSLIAAGLSAELGREFLLLVFYALCCSAFCQLLRVLCGSLRVLGTVIPLLVVAMLGICPVFFDLGVLRQLQYLFPPTYYINGVYTDQYIWYMLLHAICTWGIYFGLSKLLKR